MADYRVSFEITVPDDVEFDRVWEWVSFELRDKCSLKHGPLSDEELVPNPGTLLILER